MTVDTSLERISIERPCPDNICIVLETATYGESTGARLTVKNSDSICP